MDPEGNAKDSESSTITENTPLLTTKTADLYTKEQSSSESPCGEGSSAAEASKTAESDEDNPSLADKSETRKHRETEEEELGDAVNSYEGMADMVSPALGCGLYNGLCMFLCHCLSSFKIQFPLHILLLALPISTGFMGARYMEACPMNTQLPYAAMVVGGMGTLVLLVRLALLLHTKFSSDERLKKWMKKGIKFLELIFLVCFIFQVCLCADSSSSQYYCNKTFFNFITKMNNVFISLVVLWIYFYCITGLKCMRGATPP